MHALVSSWIRNLIDRSKVRLLGKCGIRLISLFRDVKNQHESLHVRLVLHLIGLRALKHRVRRDVEDQNLV